MAAGDAMTVRKVFYMPLDELEPAAQNPKGHDSGLLATSISRFGLIDIPTIDERTGRLVAGHGRRDDLLARRERGEEPPDGVRVVRGVWQVPVQRGWASVDDAEAAAAGIAANQSTIAGGWDDAALASMLAELAESERGLEGLGFDQADLDELIRHVEFDARVPLQGDPDVVPEPPKVAVTQPGDLWVLGEHRLLCGNSMHRADVLVLMGDERADVMVTDPPYGVAFGGDKGKNAISGDLTQAAIPVAFALSLDVLNDDARVYLFGGTGNWSMYAGLFDAHLRMQVHPIVWVKNGFVLRPNNYHSGFEMIYFGWKGRGGSADHWYGDRSQVDVWRVDRDAPGDKEHPTQKPVEVCAIPIRNSCPPRGLIYEPFGGSGSTLIAAQMEDRVARVMELDVRYCDVICARFQRVSGVVPLREGVPHDFLAE